MRQTLFRATSASRGVGLALLACCTVSWSASAAFAQGVTTGQIVGIVTDSQQQPVAGASVIAIHEPSGTTYEATTRNV